MPTSVRKKLVVLWTAAGTALLSSTFLISAYSDHVATCLARYSKPKLAPADIRRFIEQGQSECFVRGDPKKLAKQAVHLPFSLGIDARNGKAVEVVYMCSDICPAYGSTYVLYAGISEDACCASGGLPLKYSMGGVLGCLPPESPPPLARFYFPRHPGGPPELATRAPCEPTRITFDDGTVMTAPLVRTQ